MNLEKANFIEVVDTLRGLYVARAEALQNLRYQRNALMNRPLSKMEEMATDAEVLLTCVEDLAKNTKDIRITEKHLLNF